MKSQLDPTININADQGIVTFVYSFKRKIYILLLETVINNELAIFIYNQQKNEFVQLTLQDKVCNEINKIEGSAGFISTSWSCQLDEIRKAATVITNLSNLPLATFLSKENTDYHFNPPFTILDKLEINYRGVDDTWLTNDINNMPLLKAAIALVLVAVLALTIIKILGLISTALIIGGLALAAGLACCCLIYPSEHNADSEANKTSIPFSS